MNKPTLPPAICCYCPSWDQKAASNKNASHGICPTCLAKLMAELDTQDAARKLHQVAA
jgi:hypothetical protein